MFVLTNALNNNNKFWEISLHDDGHVITRNGRIDKTSVTNDLGFGGKSLYQSKIREKERKGYQFIPIIGQTTIVEQTTQAVSRIAQEQIAQGDPILEKLIKRLSEENRHQLLMASGGKIDISLSTGLIKTSVGVVTLDNVLTARDHLSKIESFVTKNDFSNRSFIDLLEKYLMLVPQKVGAKRGWHEQFFAHENALIQQSNLLDQLEASIDLAEKEIENQQGLSTGQLPKVFDVKLKVVKDCAVFDKIKNLFRYSLNSKHSSSHLKPTQVYEIAIPSMQDAWSKDGELLDNKMTLWHGTRTHNVLSILKQGLIIARPRGSIALTGRMFGDGLYFSDQSSKSLNYSQGYWSGGGKDNNCFMFLADVAMENMYKPSGKFSGVVNPRYDSAFVRGGTAGVLNNEMIVYRTSQANLRYLIEFTSDND